MGMEIVHFVMEPELEKIKVKIQNAVNAMVLECVLDVKEMEKKQEEKSV